MKVPEMKALYQAGVNEAKRSAYAVAITDLLTKPVVKDIDKSVYTGAIGQGIKVLNCKGGWCLSPTCYKAL